MAFAGCRLVARQIKPQAGAKTTQTHKTGYRAYTSVGGRYFVLIVQKLFKNCPNSIRIIA